MSCDVVVVGAGMVGSTLACALGQAGLNVVVVDATRPVPAPAPDDPYDLRVSALSRASQRILHAVGAWERLPASRLGPFREMHVWDAAGGGAIHFDGAEVGAPELGHVVENRLVQAALDERLQALPNVRALRPAHLEALSADGASAVLTAAGETVHARLVIGADGTRSRVRELAGIEARVGEYGQSAVVACVRVGAGHADTAWQRFLSTGPLAFLPLPGDHAAIVWSTTPEQAAELRAIEPEAFARRLGEAIEWRLGAVSDVGERAAFPLVHLHARRYVDHRVALVGDAAHTIHPLAGQGVNLGLLDAAALAEIVLAALARGRDPGRAGTLRPYERWRRGHNALVRQAMTGFHLLFGSELRAVRLARSAGLRTADHIVPLKRAFMRFASGLGDDLPRMARVPL